MGIATTFLVCVVLTAGALIFSKLTTDLVISPIEHMIEKVNNITKDPLKAAHDEEERLLFEELAEKDEMDRGMSNFDGKLNKKHKEEEKEGPLETKMLE